MFWLKVLFFVKLCLIFYCKGDQENISQLASAIEIFINEIIQKGDEEIIDFIKIVENEKNGKLIDLENEILKRISRAVCLRIDDYLHMTTSKLRVRHINIIYLEKIELFYEFEKSLMSYQFSFYGYYIFILYKGHWNNIQEIFDELWNKRIYNIYVFHENETEIDLITFNPLGNSKNCNDIKMNVVNKFINGKFMHSKLLYYKLKNLQGCPLRVVTLNEHFDVTKIKHSNGTIEYIGHAIDLMNAVAEALNFRPIIDLIEDGNKWGDIYKNGTATGTVGKLLNKECEIAFGDWFLLPDRTKIFDNSLAHGSTQLVFLIPPAKHFTSIENLVRPFHWIVWILFVLTFLIGLLTILIINVKFKKLKSFVYGRNVKYPTMNMFSAIFGMQQNILPKRNFARFLLMLFLIFCLILRSIYQGALFEFLQLDDRHKQIKTLKSLFKSNLQIYTYDYFDIIINDSMPELFKKIKHVYDHNNFIIQPLKETDEKAGLENLKYIIYENRKKRQNFLHYCKEEFLTISYVWYFPKKSYLIKKVNRKIEAFIEVQNLNLEIENKNIKSDFIDAANILVKKMIKFSYKTINIITAVNKSAEFRLSLLKTEILKRNGITYGVKICNSMKIPNEFPLKKRFIIFMLDNYENFQKLIKKITNQKFNFRGIFVFIMVNGFIQEIDEIYEKMWSKSVSNIYSLHETKTGEIYLSTINLFENASNCYDIKPKIVNQFVNGTFLNEINFFADKFSQMNNCSIRVTTFEDKTIMKIIDYPNGTIEVKGPCMKLLEMIAQQLNFSFSLNILREPSPWGFIHKNGTLTGALKELSENSTDISLGLYYLRLNRMQRFDKSTILFSTPLVMVLPPNRRFTSLEKLVQPFHWIIWFFLLITFLAGFFVIILINFKLKYFKFLIYGENISSPTLNMIAAIFGLSQPKLPKKNFARILLMSFLLFCLIIRNTYQGLLFKFLQSDGRHKGIQSLEEIFKQNFTIYIYESEMDLFQKIRIPIKFFENENFLLNRSLQENEKVAVIDALIDIIVMNERNKNKFQHKLFKEPLITTSLVFYMRRHFFLSTSINNKIDVILSSGFLEYWMKNTINYETAIASRKRLNEEPKAINIDELKGYNFISLESDKYGDDAHQNLKTEILKKISKVRAVRIINKENGFNLKDFKRFSILFIHNLNEFKKFEKYINAQTFKGSGFHLIFLLHGNLNDLHEIFASMWIRKIFNIYAILCNNAEDKLDFYTIEPFQNFQNCGDTTPKLLNKFINDNFLYELLIKEKFHNLNKCPIKVTTFNENIAVFREIKSNGKIELRGYEIHLIKTIAKSLNFTLQINFREGNEQFGKIYENGTATETLGELQKGNTNIALGDFYIRISRLEYFDCSETYLNYPIVFIISKGEKLSPLEKMLQPFGTIVWILFLLTFLLGVLVIFIINLKYKKLKSFVYGKNVKNPVMNMLVITLGSQQNILPRNNFARFILINFIILCLVLRSIYQGSLYKFLQSDGRYKEVETIEELIDKNFTLLIHESNIEILTDYPKLLKQSQLIKRDVVKDSLDKMMSSSKKVTILGTRVIFIDYSRDHRTFPYKLLKENLMTISVVMYYQKDFYLKDAINSKIRRIVAGGLVNYWLKEFDHIDMWNNENFEPKVLTFDHMIGAFGLLIIGNVLALLIFIIEILI
ncbi:hypothetical protein PVAND_010772 [Polypedilum vanderplanki]|uniref:Ionotropic glutamate receptor L-glutamate and glycine-binding domain-containing protein n=1 Tax=Polypedilum vanderplanki TaxID=319348 RepID=A0A9J6CHA6_POLVA|nr:hypothetical protein PVAND_010772 [Polypedilum vanderplanki]